MTSKDYTQFIVVPANKQSIINRKPIIGVGINDADYIVQPRINGKKLMCPYYMTWFGMIWRCYSESLHLKRPTYIGCTVASEWLTFSNFRAWMVERDWQGKHLDKDILFPRNKIYSSGACAFVTKEINMLLTDSAANRGNYPQGVVFHKQDKRYHARMKVNGNLKYLGRFDTPEEASSIYREAKRLHILTIACCEPDIRVKQGLYRHSELLRSANYGQSRDNQ
jgi:hypothetical protein